RDLGADQEVRVPAHVTGNEHGLTGKGARRALAVDDEPAPGTVHLVLFFLGDVVGDVVDGAHAEITGGDAERARDDLASPVRQHLAVREGEVRGGAHGAQIRARLLRIDRGARELAVGHGDAVAPERLAGDVEVVGAHLMAEAARARVDHHGDDALGQAERARPRLVHGLDGLDFEEVVARSERAELPLAALAGVSRHARWRRARPAALRLDPTQILPPRGAAAPAGTPPPPTPPSPPPPPNPSPPARPAPRDRPPSSARGSSVSEP